MNQRKNKKIIILGLSALIVVLSAFLFIVWQSSVIPRLPYSSPEAMYNNWEDILSNPKPISIRSYSTGTMQTYLSGIMNLEHEKAEDIEDVVVEIPVVVNIIQHPEFGAHLIDAGLDASYTKNPYGSIRGILVKQFLGRGSQEPGTHIAAILFKESIHLNSVWLTHMHFDHTPGILDLPKDIPYIVGKDELYPNFRFFMQSDHLAGIDNLYEIDFSTGVDLPPFGKSMDLFGDGSFWAISSSGHSKGHVMYFINGIDEKVLVTGDACNIKYQFDTGIGPGTYSSDVDGAQDVLDRIIIFKERYPDVRLVFGHDL